MHQLSTHIDRKTLVARKIIELELEEAIEINNRMVHFYGSVAGIPFLDGYGYNHANIDTTLDGRFDSHRIALFLMWFSEQNQTELEPLVPVYNSIADAFIQGQEIHEEMFEPFRILFLGMEEYVDTFERLSHSPLDHFLHTILYHGGMSEFCELFDRMHYLSFVYLRDVVRLSFLDSDFATYDPNLDSPSNLGFSTPAMIFADQEREMAKWGETDIATFLDCGHGLVYVNPYKGGGFSCMH